MDAIFLEEGEKSPVLGPFYFAAREAAKKFVQGVDPAIFEPIIKKAADDFYAKLMDDVQSYLMSNVEDNAQGKIWRGIDDGIKAILAGDAWALQRYVLTDRYDGEKVRAVIAKHIPQELRSGRIADLEKEVAELRRDLEFARRY